MSPKNFGRANIHQCPCDANILLYFDVGIKSVILHCNDRFNAIRKTTPPYVAGVELVLRYDRLMWSRTLDLEDNFRPGRLKKIEFSCPNLITKTTTFNWQTKRWWRATYIGTPAKWRKSQINVLTQASELQRKRNPTKWATIQKVDILLLEIRLIAGVIAKITYRTSYWLSYSKSRFADVWREFLQKPSHSARPEPLSFLPACHVCPVTPSLQQAAVFSGSNLFYALFRMLVSHRSQCPYKWH